MVQHATCRAPSNNVFKYLASETFLSLPAELRTISYATVQDDPTLLDKYSSPSVPEQLSNILPPTIPDSLTTYNLLPAPSDLPAFLTSILTPYLDTATAPLPSQTPQSRADACEICEREHLPLTYHHLIPRSTHAKAVKRGWHADWELANVAWLCRACHSFVHRLASNEELARELFSVELLMEREEVVRWAAWVGRVRWKAR